MSRRAETVYKAGYPGNSAQHDEVPRIHDTLVNTAAQAVTDHVLIQGWMGYFAIAKVYHDIPEVDGWIRRRVRLCYWEQWRWCRTKVRKLLALGTERFTAIRAGLNRNGPWAMSRRLAAHTGMTNQWLKEQGLFSVKDLWVKRHCPATAR